MYVNISQVYHSNDRINIVSAHLKIFDSEDGLFWEPIFNKHKYASWHSSFMQLERESLHSQSKALQGFKPVGSP